MKHGLRSLTGFGSGIANLGEGQVAIEVRAVNHRFFEARVRLPTAIAEHASFCEDIVRRHVQRGRVEIAGRLVGTGIGSAQLDTARAKEALRALVELRDAVMPEEPVPVGLIAGLPGLFVEASSLDSAEIRTALEAATTAACIDLEAMRATEGRALADDLKTHIEAIRRLREDALARVPLAIDAARDRLHERVRRAVDAAGIALDASRLEHEIILLADRSDVAEELTRLASHLDQLDALLSAKEPVGRKMDFLLQEVGREVNTLGSKSSDVALARTVVDLKTEVERLREQCQNVL
jgi:uncharacterized protein (TIGR00255 family)